MMPMPPQARTWGDLYDENKQLREALSDARREAAHAQAALDRQGAPLDLTTIDPWLQQCGPCDAGLPMSCSHPEGDYRNPMIVLYREVERQRAAIDRVEVLCDEATAKAIAAGWQTPDRAVLTVYAVRRALGGESL